MSTPSVWTETATVRSPRSRRTAPFPSLSCAPTCRRRRAATPTPWAYRVGACGPTTGRGCWPTSPWRLNSFQIGRRKSSWKPGRRGWRGFTRLASLCCGPTGRPLFGPQAPGSSSTLRSAARPVPPVPSRHRASGSSSRPGPRLDRSFPPGAHRPHADVRRAVSRPGRQPTRQQRPRRGVGPGNPPAGDP